MIIAESFLLVANLIILGLNLKLYTEVLKDNNMNKRAGK